jgi:hypothetical protein
MAALVKRREAAKRRKAELAAAKAMEAFGPILPVEAVAEPTAQPAPEEPAAERPGGCASAAPVGLAIRDRAGAAA